MVVLPVVVWLCSISSSWALIVDVGLIRLLEVRIVMRLRIEGVVTVLTVGPLRVVIVVVVIIGAIGNIFYRILCVMSAQLIPFPFGSTHAGLQRKSVSRRPWPRSRTHRHVESARLAISIFELIALERMPWGGCTAWPSWIHGWGVVFVDSSRSSCGLVLVDLVGVARKRVPGNER